MYESTFDGIRFIEGQPARAKILGPIRVRIGGVMSSAQLKNLDDVKRVMAKRARELGANTIINFKYGQKSVGFFSSLFQRDDVNWYGEGQAATL